MNIVGIHERPDLRNRVEVFKDRAHAGTLLGKMLSPYPLENGIVLAIPAGGVPVGLAIADIANLAEAVFCANIRKGDYFAVAEAYQCRYDVTEDEVINMMGRR